MNNANTDPGSATNEGTREIHPAVITWSLVIGLIVAFIVTASSFKLSFATLYDLGAMAGLRDSAWVIPVVLDGPILAAGIFRIALSQHTDRHTVLGRRFIVAVFALAGLASMAGNAYHAVLTVADLNAAVAAAIGALAPLMVMTMCEMMAIAISAPRRHIPIAAGSAGTVGETEAVEAAATQEAVSDAAAGTTSVVDEDIDNGRLKSAVWRSARLYLANPDWSFSDIAERTGVHTSTVSRHIKLWHEVLLDTAIARSTDPENGVGTTSTATNDHRGDHAEVDGGEQADDEYPPVDLAREYADAGR